MNMLAMIQPASAPNTGSVWPGMKGQADKSEFQVMDHAPPGPEPPPPDTMAKGEEATSTRPTASSQKPDSLPETRNDEAQAESQTDPVGSVHQPPGADADQGKLDPNAPAAAQAAAIAAAIAISSPAGLFDMSADVPVLGNAQDDPAISGVVPAETAATTGFPAIELADVDLAGAESTSEGVGLGAQIEVDSGLPESSVQKAESVPMASDLTVAESAVDPDSIAGKELGPSSAAAPQSEKDVAQKAIVDDAVLQKLRPVSVNRPDRGIESHVSPMREGVENQVKAPEAGLPGAEAPPSDSSGAQTQGGSSNAGGSQTGGQSADSAASKASASALKADATTREDALSTRAAEAVQAGAVAPHAPKATDSVRSPGPTKLEPSESRRALAQVADRIEMLAAIRPKDGVTVRLDPEHLGSITIKVLGSAKEISAELTASNDSVRTALREHSGELTQALSARGVQLQSVQVGSETAATMGGRHQGSFQTFEQAQAARFHHGFRREATTDGFTLEQARGYARRATGVDVWV